MQEELLIDNKSLKFILSTFLFLVVGSCRTFLKSWPGGWLGGRTCLLCCSPFCFCHSVTVVIVVTLSLISSLGSSELFGLPLIFPWPPVAPWHVLETGSLTSWKPSLRIRINVGVVVLGKTFLLLGSFLLDHSPRVVVVGFGGFLGTGFRGFLPTLSS